MTHKQQIADIYERESRRVFASLVRLLGDFDLAEDAMHEAFAQAMSQWQNGLPDNPRAWLVSTGRFRAIDALRRQSRFDSQLQHVAQRLESEGFDVEMLDQSHLADDQLRLIFTCCHPALAADTQVALTLREVCGLRTDEIAAAFLTSPATVAQRIVRGKAKIRDVGIEFSVPPPSELPQRLDTVLSVIYLVFNEGYSASSGESLVRADVSGEAIRLGRLLAELLPEAEALGLLALMLLHESRRAARCDDNGNLVLLEDQNRQLWNRAMIAEGQQLVSRALATPQVGIYGVQAAISAEHAVAASFASTNWAKIVGLYDLLLAASQSPVVALNRAAALSMRDGPAVALAEIDSILAGNELVDYHLAHAARADMLRRLGRTNEARDAYRRALDLARQQPERRFLERRLRELS
jgi:RNA polymerase sigma-70 factor (ECF subfamily)